MAACDKLTVVSNELYTVYGAALPSNTDISITQSGTFNYSIAEAVTNANGWGANEYWAAFNDITTGAAIPEPATWAMMLIGLGGLGTAARARRRAERDLAALEV